MDILARYKNGNTEVTLHSDGSKVREFEDAAKPEFPESVDLKITDFCDGNCSFCHEQSTTQGAEGDVDYILSILEGLPSGVELALGGGNPLSHPRLEELLLELRRRGIIANMTINQIHLKPYRELIDSFIKRDLVKGVGVSITKASIKEADLPKTSNLVFHVIAGIQAPTILQNLWEVLPQPKVLILGYKDYGFGKDFITGASAREHVENNIAKWKKELPNYVGKLLLSFDNLAIKQLNVCRLFTTEGWERFYMGDDGMFTMYVDAVSRTYAISSTKKRIPLNANTIVEAFQDIIKHKGE